MRLIEIPDDGIVRIPIMRDNATIGERRVDLSKYPTIDAAPVVHARWTAECVRGDMAFRFRCSSCMGDVWYGYLVRSCDYNYCPNCGARMDGESE